MDSRHGLEIGAAFPGHSAGVPVELVEAEHQSVDSVLGGESGRRDGPAPEEEMDVSVEAPTPPERRQLGAIGPEGLSIGPQPPVHFPSLEPPAGPRVQMSEVERGPPPLLGVGGMAAAGGHSVPEPPRLVPSSRLANSVEVAAALGGEGPAPLQLGHATMEQLHQLQQASRSLAGTSLTGTQALEIAPDSITFPSSQDPLSGGLASITSSGGGTSDSMVIERARQILKNYTEIDITGGMPDPSGTGGPGGEGGVASTMDTGPAMADHDTPSSPESNFDSSELLNTTLLQQDDVMSKLAQAGPVGIATAAAVMSSGRKRKRVYAFETNPALRKRHCSKLIKKLKDTIDELTARVGLQAAVVMYKPGKQTAKAEATFKVFGAAPLIGAVQNQRGSIIREMDETLHQHGQSQGHVALPVRLPEPSLQDLPPLVFEGIPTPVHKMTQAQLRAFIPSMLKFSTGRGKPGWGKEDLKPSWWPVEVPWANVRSDCRSDEQKKALTWTDALRRIVICCYLHHGRIDLLPEFSAEQLQQLLSAEAAEQLQVQLARLQQQHQAELGQAAPLGEGEGPHLGAGQPSELVTGDSQQVFTVDTGMGNCDTSGMPTLADATLAETASRLQQVADETGQVQYATQTVTVTDRDAKALGQPVGSTTTVLLTAYPGGHSGADTSEQYLAQGAATPTTNMPSVQVVYSASHIESIPDSIVSSISSTATATALTFSPSSSSPHTSTLPISSHAPLPPPPGTITHHSLIGTDASADYLNPATSSIMAQGLGDATAGLVSPGHTSHDDLASQLINQYAAASETAAFGRTVDSGGVTMATGSTDAVSLHAGSASLSADALSAASAV